ncbi:hypothetical protein F511_38015 [Dorcoceras hygrometricum]|uniref:Uncharacterized protein n=1 Tax=Dorcoceras hygrometricum TaxID=472368 RepID=A0A2Z7A2B0_9LAMI|nr:hypothetical protein F511_38015 [Dorcoceras hygrometricum]
MQADEEIIFPVVDLIDDLPPPTVGFLVKLVGARRLDANKATTQQPQRDLGVKPQYGEQQIQQRKAVDKYADAMQEIEQRAYIARHIIHAQPIAVTKLNICTLTSGLCLAHAVCHNESPSNADPPPAKPIQATAEGLQLRTTAAGSYDSTSARSTFQSPRKALTNLKDYTREMSLRSSSNSSTAYEKGMRRNALARAVQRYHSRSRRSYLPTEIETKKVMSSRELDGDELNERLCLSWTPDSIVH